MEKDVENMKKLILKNVVTTQMVSRSFRLLLSTLFDKRGILVSSKITSTFYNIKSLGLFLKPGCKSKYWEKGISA